MNISDFLKVMANKVNNKYYDFIFDKLVSLSKGDGKVNINIEIADKDKREVFKVEFEKKKLRHYLHKYKELKKVYGNIRGALYLIIAIFLKEGEKI